LSWPRRIFDALEGGLAPLAGRWPRLAFTSAAAAGRLRNRLSRRWPSPEQVQTLFPGLEPGEAARVAWRIGGLEARNRLLIDRIRRQGLDPVRPLIQTPEDFRALRPPLVLGFFHVGAVQALSPAVERLPGPVLILRQGLLSTPRPPVRVESTEGDGQRRAAVFRRALAHLAEGGFVVVALDVVPGTGFRVPVLERSIELARGPFALARIAGAPVQPLAARWRGGGVEILTGPELAVEAAPEPRVQEAALAGEAARWFERYLLESPAELGLGLLRSLLGFEPGAGS